MTSSRAEAIQAFALVAVLSGLPAMAFAQTSPDTPDQRPVTAAPRQLGQPVTAEQLPPPEASPTTAPPPDNGPTTVPLPPPVLGTQNSGAVTVAPLGASEGEAVGTLDNTNGGFASDLWSNMDRATADTLLLQLPTTRGPALRGLAHRLLATKADSPTGTADHSFLTIRLNKLLDSGFIDDAGTIAASANVQDDPEFARAQADAILYANRAGDACGNATATRLTNAEPFWIELRAYCYAVSGNSGLLDLTRSVMNEQGLKDAAFDTLLDDVVSRKSKLPGDIDSPTSLDVFLLKQAGLPVLPAIAKSLGGAASLLAMRDTGNAPNERLAAGEQAILTGAVSNDELTALADAAAFSPDQLQHALDVAANLPFLKAQALLRQAGLHENDHSRKVQLVLEALQLGEKNDLFASAAILQHAPAAAIKPIRAMRPMAAIIARALLVAGDADAAERWIAILDPKTDAGAIARLDAEINLVATTKVRAAAAQKALTTLAAQMPAPDAPALTAEQAEDALILGIYATNGEDMPKAARAAEAAVQNLIWPGRRPARADTDRLDSALDARGGKGEALVLVLNIAGGKGPGDLAPDVTLHLVTALVEEGLADTARGFAIAAALLKSEP
jgi:hypothetical protein